MGMIRECREFLGQGKLKWNDSSEGRFLRRRVGLRRWLCHVEFVLELITTNWLPS